MSIRHLAAFALLAGTALAQTPTGPRFTMTIAVPAIEKTAFAITGSVEVPARGHAKIPLVLTPGHHYAFSVGGQPVATAAELAVDVPADGPGVARIGFIGRTDLHSPRCGAAGDEIFCLNHAMPNPEVGVDGDATYRVAFTLPPGYAALAPSPDVTQRNGLQFQIARFAPPLERKTAHLAFRYVLPADFRPDARYFAWLETAMEAWVAAFGAPPFQEVLVGATRRGAKQRDVNGSPSGNLILVSRTALGDAPDVSYLATLGVAGDPSDALRRLVLAHEASHFWFGERLAGKDGWMTEGLPNYLAMALMRREHVDVSAPLALFRKLAPGGGDGPIPGTPYAEDKKAYSRAYFQGALALWEIGEAIGHDALIALIAEVYRANADPRA